MWFHTSLVFTLLMSPSIAPSDKLYRRSHKLSFGNLRPETFHSAQCLSPRPFGYENSRTFARFQLWCLFLGVHKVLICASRGSHAKPPFHISPTPCSDTILGTQYLHTPPHTSPPMTTTAQSLPPQRRGPSSHQSQPQGQMQSPPRRTGIVTMKPTTLQGGGGRLR